MLRACIRSLRDRICNITTRRCSRVITILYDMCDIKQNLHVTILDFSFFANPTHSIVEKNIYCA